MFAQMLLMATNGLLMQPARISTPVHSVIGAPTRTVPQMLWGKGQSAVEADYQRRQEKLESRRQKAGAAPKGQVEVEFPQKGKKVIAKQGEALGAVAKRAGIRIKFDCKNGRCATCQVKLNGRAAAKVCQGAKVPGGATRKLKITLDNP
eukprot:CAMPEP_0119308752 /NCGR_PEP_ID=MMETSP1333-20130426/12672_1 /TAXON_ID=418940 /ORGANISM="Scyphosphaera apsteinii, Strain RCC1455" /LENGTH=148 /DNA_ID=CAMNT_0007312593 /DNA_START=18 /DNA_END=464 /DNA_ORIENTATION=+